MVQERIKVMVVDDHEMVRRGLGMFIDSYDDLDLVAEAASGPEAIELCESQQPSVILMDLMMPGMDGFEVIRRVRAEYPTIQIIALTSSEDYRFVAQALEAGAIGYLRKNVSVDELAERIRSANDGKPALSLEATQALIQAATKPAEVHYNLTERETQVLKLLVDGLTNRQIAQRINLSNSTVKFYVSNILSKLGVSSRTEAVAIALQQKLISRPQGSGALS